MIDIPPTVAAKAREVGADAWLAALPDLVAGLEHDWQLRDLGRAYPDATEAYVAPATRDDGTSVVLKLMMPRDFEAADHEIEVLRLAGGDGCAQLFRHDEQRGAMLLERLGPSLYELGLPIEQRHAILCDVASRVWRPLDDTTLPSGAVKARWLAASILEWWERLDHPCTERAVQHALDCAGSRERAHDPARARLVHGDVHQWNTLRAGESYKLVDPDGLHADPEYDLGIVMREDPVELLRDGPRERAAWLAARTGCDETAIWEWGVVERVSTGLLGTAIGLQPFARDMLHAADVIAG